MKFRAQQQPSRMPEINLLPMMDVIMTILTFFIIVSMTLTSFQAVDVSLPQSKDGKTTEKPANPLIVGLNQQGQLLLEGKTAPRDRLAQHIAAYLNATPDGTVVLKADKQLPYERVVQVLGTLRDMGGDRVSLAIE